VLMYWRTHNSHKVIKPTTICSADKSMGGGEGAK
jgi:hypothetical protein